MAVTFDYTGKLKKIISDTGEVRGSILNSRKAIQNINNAFLKKTKIRSEIFQRRQELNRRRLENESRREQEDVLEYSKMSSISKTPGLALARTGKSFLGRIMDFISNLAIGWLLYNLPTWIGMAKEFAGRVIKLGNIIGTIVSSASGIVISLGQGLVNIVGDIAKLNFAALPNDVSSAFNQVQTNIDKMGQQFEEGFKLFSTGLDKSLTGTDIPKVGQPLPEQSYEPPLTPSFGGGTKAQQAFSYFKSQGYSDEQAAGIVGNLRQENSAMNPTLSNSIGMKGIAQWDANRWRNLEAFAKKSGMDPNAFETQLMFIQKELKTGEGGLSEKNLKSQKSLESATIIFRKQYERPGEAEANDAARIRYARETLRSGGTSVSTQPPVGSGGKVIQYITGDRTSPRYAADHGGRNYHDHIGFDSQKTRDAAMAFLTGKGWTIGSVNTGKHANGSLHYKNLAFDIPFYSGNNTKKGVTDDAKGETKLSSMLRADLISGGFTGPQLGGGSGGSSAAAVSATPGTGAMTAAGITPTSVGEDISIVIPEMGLSSSGGGGGGGQQSYGGGMGGQAPAESPATVLNNFVKNYLLVELAYL